MRIVRKDADALNVTVELTLEPADYVNKFENELKKYKNQAQIKGFRKGMTPISMIKKMYGKSVLSDVINEALQNGLYDYLDKEKLNYLGQPLPHKEDNTIVNLDVNDLKEYTFSFDLGLVQEVEVKGISESDTYDYYNVDIPDSIVDKEMLGIRRQHGNQIKATDMIESNDMVKLEAQELDGNEIKEDGWKTEFSILVEMIPDKEIQEAFLTKKVDDEIDFDIYKLEDKEREHIDKYLLKKTEDIETGDLFRAKIIEVSRVEPAELNQEFFDKIGENITDEAGFKAFVHQNIKNYYNDQATNFMNREIMDTLIESNEIELPEVFLKRYLKETNENVTEEQIETEFKAFAQNMRWSLMKAKIVKDFDLQVEDAEIRNKMTSSVVSYMYRFGQMDYNFIDSTVDKLMEDKEQVNKIYEEILVDKMFDKIDSTIKKNLIDISYDDFVKKVADMNERLNILPE